MRCLVFMVWCVFCSIGSNKLFNLMTVMKRFFIVIAVVLTACSANAQELSKKERKQLERELKKEQQSQDAAMKAQMVGAMVEHRQFVLEADRLRDKRGMTANVSPTINFIAVDSISGVLQIGSNAYVGLNGVGGITAEGPVDRYEYSYNEKSASYNVSYFIRTSAGTYDVRMVIYSDSRADATVTSNWPGRLSWSGYVVPPAVSRVYKGTSRY